MKNTNYSVLTNQQLTNLIKAQEDRLTLINSCINGLYDNIGPFNETQENSLYRWYDEKREIENDIAEMKKAMKGTVSGSIKIDFENVSREDLDELYRQLNRFTFSGGNVKYETTRK